MKKGSKLLMMAIPSKKEFDFIINKILSKSEYIHLKNSLRDFIDNFKKSIINWLERMIEKKIHNYKPIEMPDKVSTFFIIVGIVVIFVLLLFIVIKIIKAFDKNNRISEILGEKIDDKTTPHTLRTKASNYESKEDYRNAIRYGFIALLLLMHEKNIVYLDETKTNEEIYTYLKKNNFNMLSQFYSMINIFNSAWYGHNYCNKDTYIEWQQFLEVLWKEVMSFEQKNK